MEIHNDGMAAMVAEDFPNKNFSSPLSTNQNSPSSWVEGRAGGFSFLLV